MKSLRRICVGHPLIPVFADDGRPNLLQALHVNNANQIIRGARNANNSSFRSPGLDDSIQLIEIATAVGARRHDPRAWRLELLKGIIRVVPATAAALITIRNLDTPEVVYMVEEGFTTDVQRQALASEFETAPFGDPLSQQALLQFNSKHLDTITCLRSDFLDEPTWDANSHVRMYRRSIGMDDCILSLHRATESDMAYALWVFRAYVNERTAEAAGGLSERERTLVDALHRGMGGIYRGEEASRHLPPATLSPRLRQTLEHLLGGDTERQVARRMSLSVYTVHDYELISKRHLE